VPPVTSAFAGKPVPSTSQLLHGVHLDAFIDAYASLNYGFPHPQSGSNALHAFDVSNGFALNWVGANATVDPDPVGATVGLRFGPGTQIYNVSDTVVGLGNVKQAFATLRPGGKDGLVTLDFGKFDQPYGSEVADSQLNMNYTRGVLFTYAQPLFFTGLRADWAPVSAFDAKLFLVEGWNRSVADDLGKSVGTQLVVKPTETVAAYLGYMLSPEQSEIVPAATAGGVGRFDVGASTRLRHTLDAVLDLNPTAEARVLANGTYDAEQIVAASGGSREVHFYGANVAARYAFAPWLAAAMRVEAFRDPEGYSLGGFTTTGRDTTVYDGTLTVELDPDPHLKVLLDNRVDDASQPVFVTSSGAATRQFTTTVGVVVSAP
jgi:hypothetical protein